MSNRDKCIALLDSFSDSQLGNIVTMLQAAKDAITDAADDAFCNALYKEYQADPDKGQAVSIEEAAKMLGNLYRKL